MALTVDHDDHGVYAVVDCDRAGCGHHVALRPVGDEVAAEVARVALDIAQDEGWHLNGQAFCPEHRPRRRSRQLVGDAAGWVRVHVGGSLGRLQNRPERPRNAHQSPRGPIRDPRHARPG